MSCPTCSHRKADSILCGSPALRDQKFLLHPPACSPAPVANHSRALPAATRSPGMAIQPFVAEDSTYNHRTFSSLHGDIAISMKTSILRSGGGGSQG
jgi:hypothetical protein